MRNVQIKQRTINGEKKINYDDSDSCTPPMDLNEIQTNINELTEISQPTTSSTAMAMKEIESIHNIEKSHNDNEKNINNNQNNGESKTKTKNLKRKLKL